MEDTFPKLLLRNYRKWGNGRVVMRKKQFGVWKPYTWGDCYGKVKSISLGLISIGLQPGDKVSILGDNNPEWFWTELAIQSALAVPVGLTADSAAEEVKYVAEHSESRFVVVHDQEQVDKLLRVKDGLPLLQKVIYWGEKGLRHYDDSILMSLARVVSLGEEYEKAHPGLFEDNINRTKGEDTFMIQYTSGTTGLPKGVVISYNVFCAVNEAVRLVNPVYESDEFVSITLPGWGVEQGFGLLYSLWVGQKFNFAEETETVQADLREISPHTLLYPSRLWEQVASTIRIKVAESMRVKRFLFNLFLPVGYKVADLSLGDSRPNLFWRSLRALAEITVFRPLKDRFGLVRVRVPYTAGAMLAPDVIRFFRAIGLDLRQVFGSTEGCTTSIHGPDDFKYESVGIIAPGRCVRITDEGEILVDRARGFSGYYRDPDATERVLQGEWFWSGDAGYVDEDGHLVFIDRMKDMGSLADGTRFSPQYIESRLKFSPYVKDVLVLGGEHREFVGAIVGIDYDNTGHWAERKRIPYTTFADLSQKPEVCELIAKEVERVNSTMPPASRVRGFANLPKEFDPDEAEMTRTRKLRRGFIEERYLSLVESIYGNAEEEEMEIPVVYKDGRTGVMRTTVRVTRL